jgi:integrase
MTKRAAILSEKKVTQALAACGGDRTKAIFLLSVRAGLRAKEIAGLKWADVDLKDRMLRLKVTKGDAKRAIPLHRDLVPVLRALHAEARCAHVITHTTYRSRPSSPGAIAECLAYLYKVKLEWIGYSSHSGRRTFCTRAAQKIVAAGGTLADVQELMGHKALSTTRSYIETDEEAQRRVVDLL